MTPQQIRAVQSSWAGIITRNEEVAELLYQRLFELAPEYQRLFRVDPAEQHRKLAHMLDVVVAGLRKFELTAPALEELGRKHIEYGVTDEMYDTMGEALLWSLDRLIGAEFTPELKESWTAVYGALAEVLRSAAKSSP
ncbi:MAG: globin family protein [Pirellulales bacterium]